MVWTSNELLLLLRLEQLDIFYLADLKRAF